MAFKITLLVCGLVLSIQNAYSQALGYGYGGGYANAFGSSSGSSATSIADTDVTLVDVDVIELGTPYVNGFAAGNAGWGLGATGLGATGLGYAGAGASAASLAGAGLSGVNLGAAGFAGASSSAASAASLSAAPVYLNLNSFSSGGVLPVTSIGSVVPIGITVVSDNTIEGTLALNGQLPFLAAVALEGSLASGGSGLAECGCGATGNIGIISESVGPAVGASALGVGYAGLAGRPLLY